MDVKQAIDVAKLYAAHVFAEEATSPPTLEEVRYDETHEEWLVTVGIRRKTAATERPNAWADLAGRPAPVQLPDYKVVRISDRTGNPVAIENLPQAKPT